MDLMSVLFEKNAEGKWRPSAGKIISWLVVILALWQWLPFSIHFELWGISVDKPGYGAIESHHALVLLGCLAYLVGKKFTRAYAEINGLSGKRSEVG